MPSHPIPSTSRICVLSLGAAFSLNYLTSSLSLSPPHHTHCTNNSGVPLYLRRNIKSSEWRECKGGREEEAEEGAVRSKAALSHDEDTKGSIQERENIEPAIGNNHNSLSGNISMNSECDVSNDGGDFVEGSGKGTYTISGTADFEEDLEYSGSAGQRQSNSGSNASSKQRSREGSGGQGSNSGSRSTAIKGGWFANHKPKGMILYTAFTSPT
jgi:hypothetical protein